VKRSVALNLIMVALAWAGGYAFSQARAARVSVEPQGWTDAKGVFTPWTCERTRGNGDAFETGAERWLITTHDTIADLMRHGEVHHGLDAAASPDWHGEVVRIDYKKQHEVCVSNMPGLYICDRNAPHRDGDLECPNKGRTYTGPVTRCFDLYEIGER
jgi:hypothetical protein